METFEFSVHVRVTGSRQATKRIAEAVAELLEDAWCPPSYGRSNALQRAVDRTQGLTVEVTGVTKLKAMEANREPA